MPSFEADMPSYDYPVDIQSSGVPFILITASEYATVNMVVEGYKSPEKAKYRLIIPQSIQSSDNISYEQSSILKAAALSDLTSAVAGLANIMSGFVSDDIKNNFAGGLGLAFNPKEELLFKSPDLRTHTFTFNMFVKNKKEGDAIVKIIKSLREKTYPSIYSDSGDGAIENFVAGGNNVFNFPHQFSVEMHNGGTENAFPYIPAAFITSITTNYAGSGRVSLTPDDHFQAIELTLAFQDIRISTSDQINN
jgi:hypothetical protein